jgi:hypothetical protein
MAEMHVRPGIAAWIFCAVKNLEATGRLSDHRRPWGEEVTAETDLGRRFVQRSLRKEELMLRVELG